MQGRELFDRLWACEPYAQISMEEAIVDKILELCREKNARRVLSVGCGQGAALRKLLEHGIEAYGVDISPVALKACEDLGDRVKCVDFSTVREPLFGKIDLLYSVDALQCIPAKDLDGFFKAAQAQQPSHVMFMPNLGKDLIGPSLLKENSHALYRYPNWWTRVAGEYFKIQKSTVIRNGFAACMLNGVKGRSSPAPTYRGASPGESETQREKRFQRNLEVVIARNMIKHAEDFFQTPEADYREAGLTVGFSPLGEPFGALKVGDKVLAIDDPTSTREEAQAWARGVRIRSDEALVLMVGLGFGYGAEELLRLMAPNSHLVVVDPYAAMLRAALEYRDLRPLLQDARFHLVPSIDDFDVKGKVTEIVLRNANLDASRPTARPAYATLLGDKAVELAHTATVRYFAGLANKHTTETECVVWSEQLLRNLNWIIDYPGLEGIDRMEKAPAAVVVGAGPSLGGSLEFLRAMQERVPILAVDVAVPKLLAAGIHPHIVVVMDRSEICFNKVKGIDPARTGLMLFSQVYPGFADMDAAFKIINIENIVCDLFKDICVRRSSEHMAFVGGSSAQLARHLGARTMYLVGMDFAFAPDGSTHVEGAHSEKGGAVNPDDLKDEWLPVPGNTHDKLRTNRLFKIYLDQFRDFVRNAHDTTFIPVTNGGAKIGDLRHVLPEDALCFAESYPKKDWLETIASAVRSAAATQDVGALHARMRKLSRELLGFRDKMNATKDRKQLICILDDLVHHPCHFLVEWIFVETYYSLFGKQELKDEHIDLVRDRLNTLEPALRAIVEFDRQSAAV
ncbi:MAG: DUF115 domain-containing protein [Planctomycetota bacterium]|nr:DUF115 domain-containing protein [Planctomycetota bacterium]